MVGLRSKKPSGSSLKPIRSTGITGHCSGRGTWWEPITGHSVSSSPSSERSACCHTCTPSSPGSAWFGYWPPMKFSPGVRRVAHRCWWMNGARVDITLSGRQ